MIVEDTFHALEELGRAGRSRAEAKVLAVTGSVGKTGTKEMLRLMLAATGSTYATEGSLNNHWGVPVSLARLPAEARYGVFELGMNHAGELGLLSQQVQPHVALITTIEAVHLEYFASLEAIADAKAEIFLGMTSDGIAVLNRDNLQYARLAAAAKAQGLKRILGFGRDSKCDARLAEMHRRHRTPATLPPKFWAKRSLIISACRVSIWRSTRLAHCWQLRRREAMCKPAPPRWRITNSRKAEASFRPCAVRDGTITVIDESYNASPSSVRFAARVLGQMKPGTGGRKILVLGDMRELGTEAASMHTGLVQSIVESGVDLVFCCGEMMKHLYEALPTGGRGFHAGNSAELAPHVLRGRARGRCHHRQRLTQHAYGNDRRCPAGDGRSGFCPHSPKQANG